MRVLVIALIALSSGCSGRAEFTSQLYDPCFSIDDCLDSATLCEELAVEFAGLEYANTICTTECVTEGPASPECSRALVGRMGSCYPSSVAGGIDDTLVCFEPCDTDDNCLQGFRCLDAIDLCGARPSTCSIAAADAICVPGPN